MTKARDLGKLVSQGQILADGTVQASEVTGLAAVATSGSYNDLTNKPTNLGGVTSYNDLTDKPNLATVATSGSYADLTNKPTIPSIAGLATVAEVALKANASSLATVATTGSYGDLTNKPDLSTIGGGITYQRKTSAYTAQDKDGIIADTSAGGFTVTLPASPAVGAQVFIADGSAWGVNNLTVARNGSTIEGSAEDLVLNISGVSVQLLYDGTTWEVYAQAGVLGTALTASNISGLATVATTGSYTDLVNKPAALKISSVDYPGDDLAADPAGGQTITLTGTGFEPGAQVLVDTTVASVVTVVDSTTITFTAPARAAGTYVLYVVNTDGSVALGLPGISYSGTPAWGTTAGTLGTQFETSAVNRALSASSNSTVTYTLLSGSLPPGSTLNASTGVIAGTAPAIGGSTTYNFTVRATDGENQDTDRAFSITISPDSVTWTNPANGATITAETDTVVNLALAATAASGNSVSYTANQLPAGLSLVGNAVTGTLTTAGDLTTTLTATAANTLRSSTRTVNWSILVGADPNFNRTVLLLQGNGTNAAQNNTFLDSSANNFTITRNGNTTQGSFSPYGTLWSNHFDGAGDGLSVLNNAAFQFGTGDYTVEAWVFIDSESPNYSIIAKCSAANTWGAGWTLSLSVDGNGFDVWHNASLVISRSTGFARNTWLHVAVSRNNETVSLYINGVLTGSAAGAQNLTPTVPLFIGIDNSLTAYQFRGYISNLRVIKGTGLYTSSFTPSTTPLAVVSGTSLLTCADNRFIDDSTNNFTIASNGNVSVQRFSPFAPAVAYSTATLGGSAYFDGNGDYLTVAASSAFNFGTGDYTVEGWVNSSSTTWTLYGTGGSGSRDQFVCDTGILYWGFQDGTPFQSGIVNFFTNNDLNQWVHVAVSRSGTTQRCFKNGVVMGTITTSSSYGSSTVLPEIGRRNDGSYLTTGYISNLRVVKGTGVYTANFTPPTAPLTAISGTSLLTHFTNAAIVDATAQNNLETAGNAQISTSIVRYGTGSIAFDGTGDYLRPPFNQGYVFGTGNFTIEMWLYLSTGGTGTIQVVFDFRPAANGAYPYVWMDTNNRLYYYVNGTNVIVGATALSTGVWHHFAVCRSGTSSRMFLNGVQEGSTYTDITNYTCGSFGPTIGAESSNLYSWKGYMDDIRITNGLARYTANFTPPTEQLRDR